VVTGVVNEAKTGGAAAVVSASWRRHRSSRGAPSRSAGGASATASATSRSYGVTLGAGNRHGRSGRRDRLQDLRRREPRDQPVRLGFLTDATWDPVKGSSAARDFIFGTVATSAMALVLATPISIAIGLYLSELAPKGLRGVIATLVEMLAAIPSVVLGLWGDYRAGAVPRTHVEPWLHRHLGFIPLFGATVASRHGPLHPPA
jgi:ABC-type Fe3+ transport system permease subunit